MGQNISYSQTQKRCTSTKLFHFNLIFILIYLYLKLLKYDIELSQCDIDLHELVRKFPPRYVISISLSPLKAIQTFGLIFDYTNLSYPFSEELNRPDEYMESRCPSWCDRIVLNTNLKSILDSRASNIEYSMLGENTCMGDHKVTLIHYLI